MRRAPLLALIVLALSTVEAPEARGAAPTRERVSRYFEAWFSSCPATKVTVTPASEIRLPGYESFTVERSCDLKNRNEMSITLVDTARNEIFVGEVLHDDTRRGRPFSPAQDVPVMQGALADVYGLPVTLEVLPGSRGPLKPIRLAIRQAEGVSAARPGFVSEDGASLLLGEFQPLDVAPAARRRQMLAESPGVRPTKGAYFVTAFIDFQCERCRVRTPELRDYAFTHGGGALEVRFLPLVKVHEWSFAAAETAAALAGVSPPLYLRYEEAVFPRASTMNPAAARQLGADVAEAAGVGPAFAAELSSGRARQRVVRDIELAMRLGLNGTPVFFDEGVFLTAEPGLAENAIGARLGAAPAASGRNGAH